MLGINLSRPSGTSIEDLLAQVALAKSLGAQSARVPMSWAELEPARGVYMWGDTDRVTDVLGAVGITPHLLLLSPPPWARPAGTTYQDPPSPSEAVRSVCTALAARYAGRDLRLEAFNEVEFVPSWTPSITVAVWAAARAGAKAGDPDCTALNGGIGKSSVLRGMDLGGWLGAVLANPDFPVTTDMLNVHYYGNTTLDMAAMWTRLRYAMNAAGHLDVPLTLSEIGRSSRATMAPYIGESGQARYVTEVVGAQVVSGYWSDVVTFKAQDRRLDRGTFAYHGLVGSGGREKPAADAYRALSES